MRSTVRRPIAQFARTILTIWFLVVVQGAAAGVDGGDEYEGKVEAVREAELSALFDGWLQKIHFQPGTYVEEGDLLFEFSPVEREILLPVDYARLKRAKTNLELKTIELERVEGLTGKEVYSKVKLLEAQAAKVTAEADVEEAQAKVNFTKTLIKFTKLRAPISGIISRPFVREGTYLTKAAREDAALAIIQQLDPIRVVGRIPYDVFLERRGARSSDDEALGAVSARLILPNGEVYPLEGTFVSGGFEFDEESQTIDVYAEFPNPDYLLRPGLKVKLRTEAKK